MFVSADLGQVVCCSFFRVDSINKNTGVDESLKTRQVALDGCTVKRRLTTTRHTIRTVQTPGQVTEWKF